MGKVLVNPYISLGGTNRSEFFTSVELPTEADTPEDTRFNAGGWRTFAPDGLKTWTVAIELNQDYSAGQIDSIIWPLFAKMTAIEIRPDAGAVSTDNAKWTGNGIVKSHMPVAGSVGEIAKSTISIQGSGVLTRAES